MENSLKEIIWSQFGASIDMLLSTIESCPDEYFETSRRFFYIAYHTALFLDYYLTLPPSDFIPLLPFSPKKAKELPIEAIGDLIPARMYTKKEVLGYLFKSREKCKNLIFSLTKDKINERFYEGNEPNDMDFPIVEILLYNLRHTQHHTAQLNLLLRQDFDIHSPWSFRADDLKGEESH